MYCTCCNSNNGLGIMKYVADHIKSIIALTIIVSGIGYFYITTLAHISPNDQIVIAIVAFINMVLGYFFGTTQNSSKKDDTIQELSKNKEEIKNP